MDFVGRKVQLGIDSIEIVADAVAVIVVIAVGDVIDMEEDAGCFRQMVLIRTHHLKSLNLMVVPEFWLTHLVRSQGKPIAPNRHACGGRR